MSKYILALLFASISLLSSCTKIIDFENDLLDTQLVVNSIITPDSLIKVNVYQNVSINETEAKQLSNATVTLFEDGVEIETLEKNYDILIKDFYSIEDSTGQWTTEIIYDTIPTYYGTKTTVAKAGKTYQLRVSCDGYDDVSCETTIPYPVEIVNIDTTTSYELSPNYKKTNINFKLKFKDPLTETNYYRLILEQTRGNREGIVKTEGDTLYYINIYKYGLYFFNSSDPILNIENNDPDSKIIGTPWSDYVLFTDERINGTAYELSFSYSDDFSYSENKMHDDLIVDFENGEFVNYTIYLQNLNAENYLYYTSFDAQEYYRNFLVMEPVPVYSNVENGLGFFGSYSTSSKNIMVGEYLKDGVYYGKEELMDKYGPEVDSYPDLK